MIKKIQTNVFVRIFSSPLQTGLRLEILKIISWEYINL